MSFLIFSFAFSSLCGRRNRPHYGLCPSVRQSIRLSVCLSRTGSAAGKQKGVEKKTELVREHFQDRNNRRANFQFKEPKVKVISRLGLGWRRAVNE